MKQIKHTRGTIQYISETNQNYCYSCGRIAYDQAQKKKEEQLAPCPPCIGIDQIE